MLDCSITVWRLMAHHENPLDAVRWAEQSGVLAIGWGRIGDLRKLRPASSGTFSKAISDAYPGQANRGSGGVSLYQFLTAISVGDLVIVSADGKRRLVMEVQGDYGFEIAKPAAMFEGYQHQRHATAVNLNADRLWEAAGSGASAGQNMRWPLIRCPKPIDQGVKDRLVDRRS